MKKSGLASARSGARYPSLGAAMLAAGLGACISGDPVQPDALLSPGIAPPIDAAIDAPVGPDGAAPLPDGGPDAAADAPTGDAADADPAADAGSAPDDAGGP